jgi:pyruvate,water dikinase
MATEPATRTFPNPYSIPTPPGAEGWETMYPYHDLFTDERRDVDEERCWILNGIHFAEPMFPFDMVSAEQCFIGVSQANSRIFAIPPALGLECRVVNGYIYFTSNGVTDPAEIERRAAEFMPRAAHYFQNWDSLYARWEERVLKAIADLESLKVPDLPGVEDMSVVMDGGGISSSHRLLVAYNRLLEFNDLIWQYHFEFLNLGYAAYLNFNQLCQQHFPGITDQAMAKMVAGIDVILFRPVEELKKLARMALEEGIGDQVKGVTSLADLEARLAGNAGGQRWLAALRQVEKPWFYFSYGNGMYHHHRSWIDDPSLPLSTLGSFVERLEAGEDIARPLQRVIEERDRITDEYRALLPEGDARNAFEEALGLARTVFPYVENHNFYVEHWFNTIWWNKCRDFGALLVKHGFIDDVEDFFFMQGYEVYDALMDLRLAWATGGIPAGGRHWKPVVAARKAIHARLRQWSPPNALGSAPDSITEPLTIMLFGVTTERINSWLSRDGDGQGSTELRGFAGSPGVVEGVARVILRVDELDQLQDGEILIAPITAPSWTPVFGRIRAAVSDIGGIMSHAAIVAREHGLPAVVGTGYGTTTIRTGQRVRVDGDNGVVTVVG